MAKSEILSLIHIDVKFAITELQSQLENNQLELLLIRSNRSLFDTGELQEYLSETKIQNTFLLKEIVRKSESVVDLYNDDFGILEDLQNGKVQEFHFRINTYGGGVFSTSNHFKCIDVSDKSISSWISSTHPQWQSEHFKKGVFEFFNKEGEVQALLPQHLALRCSHIINLVTAAYPDLTTELNSKVNGVNKLDFASENLRGFVIGLANLKGYEKPSEYLNEKLERVKLLDDFEIEQQYFLNVHYLCKEYANRFWSSEHRNDITRWLKKARIVTDVFNTTWDNMRPPQAITEEEPVILKQFSTREYALSFIFDLYANGKQIPHNLAEGSMSKKDIIKIGYDLYQLDIKKDTFYRGVRDVLRFDLNKKQDLENISIRWLEVVKSLSKDWEKTKGYLEAKDLFRE